MKTNAINLGQIQVEAGRPDLNMQKIIEQAENTKKGGILVLPEMVVPGYFIGDKWNEKSTVEDYKDYNDEIIELSQKYGITIVWGNIEIDEDKKNEDGSIRKYNASYMATNGDLIKTQYKTLLPNYGVFDDKRYFTSLNKVSEEEKIDIEEYFKPIETLINGVKTKVSMLICEDIWNINKDYSIDPLEMTKKYNPDLITVVSASPFGLEKAKFRDKLLKIQSEGTTIVYVNPVGIQNNGKTIMNFDGGSSIYSDGEFVRGVKNYEENMNFSLFQRERPEGSTLGVYPKGEGLEKKEDKNIEQLKHPEKMEQIFNALIYTIKMWWKQNGWEKASIGLSGGIDSGLVATLLTIALGKENITAINMPSKFNGDTTKNLAKQLADNLGIKYVVSSIEKLIDAEVEDYIETIGEKPNEFDLENIQARTRGAKLSKFVSKFGPYTANGNKDEIMTGYATLYGDTNGVIGILGDLTKQEVKELSRWINKNINNLSQPFINKGRSNKEIIPNKMIEMKPSAELSENQNTDSNGGDPFDYKILSAINKTITEKKINVVDLIILYKSGILEELLGIPKGYIEKVIGDEKKVQAEFIKYAKMKNNSYFKRVQYPPIPKISRAAFGGDYRESQMQFNV